MQRSIPKPSQHPIDTRLHRQYRPPALSIFPRFLLDPFSPLHLFPLFVVVGPLSFFRILFSCFSFGCVVFYLFSVYFPQDPMGAPPPYSPLADLSPCTPIASSISTSLSSTDPPSGPGTPSPGLYSTMYGMSLVPSGISVYLAILTRKGTTSGPVTTISVRW